MITINLQQEHTDKDNKQVIAPRYSRAQAYRLWKDGILSESYYTMNYMDTDERAEYYRQKRQEEIKEKSKSKEYQAQEKKQLKELEDKVYKAIDTGIVRALDKST